MGNDGPGRFQKGAASPDGLDVEGDNPSIGAGPKVFQAVHDIQIRLVSNTECGAETEAVPGEVVEHLGNETPALGCHADVAGGSFMGQKGGVQLAVRVGHANAVWAEKTYAIFFCNFFECLFPFYTFPAHLSEAAGDHDGMLDALFAALFHDLWDDVCGQHQQGHIWHLGQVQDTPVSPEMSYPFLFGVDGIDDAFKAEGLDRGEQVGSHGQDTIGGPKNGDALGVCNGV